MRILCLLTDGFGLSGGIAQFNRDLLRAMASSPEVTELVALPRNLDGPVGPMPGKLIYETAAAGGKWKYAFRLFRLLAAGPRFDLIVCCHLNLQPLALTARLATGAPVLLVLHGIDAWQQPSGLARRFAIRRADWVAAVSQVTLDHFLRWARIDRARTAVLPCCVDLTRFTPGSPQPSLVARHRLEGATVLLTLGRQSPTERYKGFDEVIAILGRLRQRVPGLCYVIAGTGADRPRLEAKARECGVLDAVRFTDFVPDSDIVDLYRCARAFVLAGYGEGFGIVLLEAMACGIPAVASTLDGSFEAIGGGRLGIAADPRDPESLSQAILAALERPRGVRPAGLDYFSYEQFKDRVYRLLPRVVAPARDARARPRATIAHGPAAEERDKDSARG